VGVSRRAEAELLVGDLDCIAGSWAGAIEHLENALVAEPEEAADMDASSCLLAEQLADRRTSIRQPLVGIARQSVKKIRSPARAASTTSR
jgi:hypothetical protein